MIIFRNFFKYFIFRKTKHLNKYIFEYYIIYDFHRETRSEIQRNVKFEGNIQTW